MELFLPSLLNRDQRWPVTECARFPLYMTSKRDIVRSTFQYTRHTTRPGRLRSKEAVLKALGIGTRKGVIDDIEIRKESSGRPSVAVHGAVKDVVERLGVAEVLVSIAHCRTHATAYAMALGRAEAIDEG